MAHTNVLTEARLGVTGRVDGTLADTNVLAEARLGIAGGIDGGLVDANFFTVCRLEARSVFTLTYVDLSLVLLAATRVVDFDVNLSLVTWTLVWEEIGEMRTTEVWKVWKLDVDTGGGLFSWSAVVSFNVDILSAARTVVTFFLASDMNFLLLLIVLLVPGGKSGRERRVLTFPSDALLSW